jgi:hypothetical protein
MRAARGFIKFKIQNSKFKSQNSRERRGGEGEKRSEVRGQGSGGGQEREILNFEF